MKRCKFKSCFFFLRKMTKPTLLRGWVVSTLLGWSEVHVLVTVIRPETAVVIWNNVMNTVGHNRPNPAHRARRIRPPGVTSIRGATLVGIRGVNQSPIISITTLISGAIPEYTWKRLIKIFTLNLSILKEWQYRLNLQNITYVLELTDRTQCVAIVWNTQLSWLLLNILQPGSFCHLPKSTSACCRLQGQAGR